MTIATPLEPRRRRMGALLAALSGAAALALAALAPAPAYAAAPAAGTYTGPSDAYTGAAVSFDIDTAGNLTRFDTQSYFVCGITMTSTPWAGVPPTPIEVGVPTDLEWYLGDEGAQMRFTLEDFVVAADGTASGEGYVSLPELGCGGLRFSFTAEREGGTDPVYDPSASADPSSLTRSELAGSGVTITGQDFPPNSVASLAVDGETVGSADTAADGSVSFTHTAADATLGAHQATITVGSWSASTSFTVNADPVVITPTASVTPSSITLADLAASGITVTGTGFVADSEVTLSVDGTAVTSGRTDAAGTVGFLHTSSTLSPGAHTVELASADGSATSTFTVTENPVAVTPVASVAPGTLTRTELATTGIVASGADFAPGSDVTMKVDGVEVTTAAADAAGAVSFPYTSASVAVGSHTVELVSSDGTASATFTVTEDPVAGTPVLTVDPTTITRAELAERGIAATGTGFAAESTVSLSVDGTEVATGTVGADGSVVLAFTSTTLGEGAHTVVLQAGDRRAETSFTVTADEPVDATIPATAPAESDLVDEAEGGIVAPATVQPGDVISIAVTGQAPGARTGVWLFSDPAYLGTQTVEAGGTVTVTIPADAALGEHRIAVWADPDTLVGWQTIDVVAPGDGDGDGGGNGGGDGNGNGGGNGGDDGGLAQTGAEHLPLAVTVGTVLLLAAGGLLVLRGRRDATDGR